MTEATAPAPAGRRVKKALLAAGLVMLVAPFLQANPWSGGPAAWPWQGWDSWPDVGSKTNFVLWGATAIAAVLVGLGVGSVRALVGLGALSAFLAVRLHALSATEEPDADRAGLLRALGPAVLGAGAWAAASHGGGSVHVRRTLLGGIVAILLAYLTWFRGGDPVLRLIVEDTATLWRQLFRGAEVSEVGKSILRQALWSRAIAPGLQGVAVLLAAAAAWRLRGGLARKGARLLAGAAVAAQGLAWVLPGTALALLTAPDAEGGRAAFLATRLGGLVVAGGFGLWFLATVLGSEGLRTLSTRAAPSPAVPAPRPRMAWAFWLAAALGVLQIFHGFNPSEGSVEREWPFASWFPPRWTEANLALLLLVAFVLASARAAVRPASSGLFPAWVAGGAWVVLTPATVLTMAISYGVEPWVPTALAVAVAAGLAREEAHPDDSRAVPIMAGLVLLAILVCPAPVAPGQAEPPTLLTGDLPRVGWALFAQPEGFWHGWDLWLPPLVASTALAVLGCMAGRRSPSRAARLVVCATLGFLLAYPLVRGLWAPADALQSDPTTGPSSRFWLWVGGIGSTSFALALYASLRRGAPERSPRIPAP